MAGCRRKPVRGRQRVMLSRRTFAVAIPAVLAGRAWAADGFQGFLAGVRADGLRAGIAPSTLDRALSGLQPNQKVLDHFNHQPEFTLSWAQYRALVVTDQRAISGRSAVRQNAAIIQAVQDRYGVDNGVVVGIWGLEFELRAEDWRLPGCSGAGHAGMADQAGGFLPLRADRGPAYIELMATSRRFG